MPTSRNPPRETSPRSTPYTSYATSSSLRTCSVPHATPQRRARRQRKPPLRPRVPPRPPGQGRERSLVRALLARWTKGRASGEKARARRGRTRRSPAVSAFIHIRTGHHDLLRPRPVPACSSFRARRRAYRARRGMRCRRRLSRQGEILRTSSSQCSSNSRCTSRVLT